MSDLNPEERQALELLEQGPYCIGTVDDEPKLATAMRLSALSDRGLVKMTASDQGPVWSLTPLGEATFHGWLDR